MSVLLFKDYFPWPIIKAPLWDGTTWFHFGIFEDSGLFNIRTGDIWIPGNTGPQTTIGVITNIGGPQAPDQYPDGAPLLQYQPVVGPGTLYPIGMSLDAAIKIYWRVQRWKMTCTWAKSYVNPDGSGIRNYSVGNTFTATIYNPNFQLIEGTPEEISPIPGNLISGRFGAFEPFQQDNGVSPAQGNIFCGAFRLAQYASDFRSANPFPFEGDAASALLCQNPLVFDSGNLNDETGVLWTDDICAQSIASPFWGPLLPKQNICYEETTKLYYPCIVFGGSVLLYDTGSDSDLPVTPLSVQTKAQETGGPLVGPIAGTLSFDEPTLKFTYDAAYTSPTGNIFAGVSLSENTTLEPELWYGYDPGDGKGPIYDTTTGARLRSG